MRDLVKCVSQQLEESRENLESYLAESRRLIGEAQKDASALSKSQESWEEYVGSDCEAAYEHFADGSIRSLAETQCEAWHTTNRTCLLWNRYLAGTATELAAPDCGDLF